MPRKFKLSDEGRKAISEAQKAKWEKKRQAAAEAANQTRKPTAAELRKMLADAEAEEAAANAPVIPPDAPNPEDVPITEDEKAVHAKFAAPHIPLAMMPKTDPVHPLHECGNCGWKGEKMTFADAIKKHQKEATRCPKPCLVQPSKKFLKQRALKEMARTGTRG